MSVEHTEGYRGEILKGASVATNDSTFPNFGLFMRAQFEEEKKSAESPPR
ncbi:MAG: hypothetical protein LAO21_19410 [Acidobacteriia bacterium]|nr:hypothetical protein [Terriglobia bacterium]